VKKAVASFLVVLLFQFLSLQFSAQTNAFSIGCKKAQSDATFHLKSAFFFQNSEVDYYRKGMYADAFRSFQGAYNSYYEWRKVVNKSPKCFTRGDYVSKTKSMLKDYEKNQSMATRYGTDIARRNNYGSPDPCFKYLGEDNAYLNCRISVGEKEGRNPNYGP
jgi:hypothetical protein